MVDLQTQQLLGQRLTQFTRILALDRAPCRFHCFADLSPQSLALDCIPQIHSQSATSPSSFTSNSTPRWYQAMDHKYWSG